MNGNSALHLLTRHRDGKSGGTKREREDALTAVIDTAFNSPNAKLRKKAAAYLKTRGVEIDYGQAARAA